MLKGRLPLFALISLIVVYDSAIRLMIRHSTNIIVHRLHPFAVRFGLFVPRVYAFTT